MSVRNASARTRTCDRTTAALSRCHAWRFPRLPSGHRFNAFVSTATSAWCASIERACARWVVCVFGHAEHKTELGNPTHLGLGLRERAHNALVALFQRLALRAKLRNRVLHCLLHPLGLCNGHLQLHLRVQRHVELVFLVLVSCGGGACGFLRSRGAGFVEHARSDSRAPST